MNTQKIISLGLGVVSMLSTTLAAKTTPPNVILLLVDDQGIGDLACQGNPWLKTPQIDAFYKQAVRMTDFHVSPLCTPTRSAIITGQYPIHNGAWATFKGRDIITHASATLGEVFKANKYQTAMIGKWHLGDNYPVRPSDCGFDYTARLSSGGIGELSDYWGNSYFDDTYLINNEPKAFKGYCTDVWFDQTIQFIEGHKDKPFFVYLPTNIAHGPLYVDEKYAAPYKALATVAYPSAEYYGMIANLDENFGRLNRYLADKGLTDNTILIYMSDNGSQYGMSKDGKIGYNKGFRGGKGDKTEGGHRVPFYIRWPKGGIGGGKDIPELTSHVDIMPTLAALCNLKMPANAHPDGVDFSKLLTDPSAHLAPRSVFVHHNQDWRPPQDVFGSCIMNGKWRLINGNELYDVISDSMELHNIAAKYPEVVSQLLKDNADFVSKAMQKPTYSTFAPVVIGSAKQKITALTIQHAIGNDAPIWEAEHVAAGLKNKNNTYAINVAVAGRYKISCMRWPLECSGTITGIPSINPKNRFVYKAIKPQKVRIKLFNFIFEKQIEKADTAVSFIVNLPVGETFLTTDFVEGKEEYGVYYTYIEQL